MLKKLPLIAVLLIAVGLFYYFSNVYQLLLKSYYVDESKLYKIDTFHLLNRAYEQSDNSGGSRRSSHPELVFQSSNRYSFVIDRSIFNAITDKDKLEDTLMYHDLKFTVFSDKGTYDKYKKSQTPILIRVYQVQIGDTNYIDIARTNSLNKSKRIAGVVFPPAVILLIFFLVKSHSNKHPAFKNSQTDEI